MKELCPSLSVSSIEGSLRKLVAEGEMKREGVGRAIKYSRCKTQFRLTIFNLTI